jgi:hypothetical protein
MKPYNKGIEMDFGKKVQSDASNYISSVLASSTNYAQLILMLCDKTRSKT